MNILFTGNLKVLSNRFFDKMSEECKCILYAEEIDRNLKGKKIIRYTYDNSPEQTRNIFYTFDFETVIYFSKALDGAVSVFDELEKLESNIYLSVKNNVKNVIYITTNDLKEYDEKVALEGVSRAYLLHTCEDLCHSYAEKFGLHITTIRIPYIYSLENESSQLTYWIREALEQWKVQFRGAENAETDFLCEEDLGELIERLIDEPGDDSYQVFNISGENRLTLAGVADLLAKEIPQVEITYRNEKDCIPKYFKTMQAREEYGWFPQHIIAEDITTICSALRKKTKKKKKSYLHRENYKKIKEKVRVALEIVAVALIAEVLNRLTENNVTLQFIDFRLFAVVLMGTMNGLSAGILTAFLACGGYIAENTVMTRWQIIFFNIQNWLPFATYLILGAVCGYTRDKHDDDVIYEKQEHDLLEKKYIFLSDLYSQVLESKEAFNNQIIGYRDSFGKIFSVVKKLNATLTDGVFYEAVNVLEETLDNDSVAIYSLQDNQNFARLSVCSKAEIAYLPKSMDLKKYPNMMNYLNVNQTFVNNRCLEDYPAYATPIMRDGKLLGLIMMLRADFSQMNMEFSNKFSIISNLISDSLIRAMVVEDNRSEFLPDTQILKEDRFKEIVRLRRQMKAKNIVDYTLLRIWQEGVKREELGNKVSALVRSNDILGAGKEDKLFLLLSQTAKSDVGIIAERLTKNNIKFVLVRG